ncbi:MAG: transposase [Cyclobacteriaceae bacterium]|nr:transposase [Cyclobacteriaceae bacterium]
MSNSYTINNQEGLYFVTCTVVNWVDVFTRQRYRDMLLESLEHCQQQKGLIIYSWCIMSNHMHMIVRANNGDLSGILRDFKKYTSKKIIESIKSASESRKEWMVNIFSKAGKENSNNKNYQFWKQDNHAEELLTNQFTKQKLDYIHHNPVVAGIVDEAELYLYSSARDYSGRKGLLHIEFVG